MRFRYISQESGGALRQGYIDAVNHQEAMDTLARQGVLVMKIETAAEAEGGARGLWKRLNLSLSVSKNIDRLDQLTVLRQLSTILNTGTDLITALDIVADNAVKPAVKNILYDIRAKILAGESFSGALALWEENFDPVFINLVKSSEAAGTLPVMFASYSLELKKEIEFSRQLRSAMIYPLILVAAVVVMLLIILTVVAPRIQELFATSTIDPPFFTKIFFQASNLLINHTLSVVAVLMAFVVGLVVMIRNKKLRKILSSLLWYLPLLRKVQIDLTLMRFSKTLSTLVKAGFPMKGSLMIVANVVQPVYQRALTDIAQEKLERGISLAEALRHYPKLFPSILTGVISTGEKTGQLNDVLEQMGEFYEEESLYKLKFLLTLVEPLLLAVVGVIIGGIAASLLAPIYRLINKF